MSHTLYTFPGHPKGNQCAIAARLAGVEVNVQNTNHTNLKTPEYLAIHSLGKIPALQTPEGTIFESNAIVKYFGRKGGLLGNTPYEQAQVSQWLDWINTELSSPFYKTLFFALGHEFGSEAQYKEGKGQLMTCLKHLNSHLNEHSYLAGFGLTVADTSLVCLIAPLMYTVIDESFLKGNQAILRWYKHVLSFEAVSAFYRQPFVTKKEWCQVKEDKKDQKPKKEKQPKQQPKKAEKKEEKKEEEKPAKAPKNEFEALPPSTFNLFDFKTYFMNEKDKVARVAEFWNRYDPTGYSIWHVKYDKLDSECKKLFLTQNLKDNTMQRLDNFRKHVFGTFGIYGEEENYDIEGVWVWRGTEIPQLLKEQPNFEYHFWNKLDHTKESDRKFLEEFWINTKEDEDKVQGKVARDVTYFR